MCGQNLLMIYKGFYCVSLWASSEALMMHVSFVQLAYFCVTARLSESGICKDPNVHVNVALQVFEGKTTSS